MSELLALFLNVATFVPCRIFQMSRIVTEDEICRYLVGCEIDLSQAIAADVGSDGGHDTRGRDEPAWEQAKAEIGLPSESGQVDPCYVEESPAELTQGVQPMSAMLGYLLEAAPHFRRLQEIVDKCVFFFDFRSPWSEGRVAHRERGLVTCGPCVPPYATPGHMNPDV